MTIGLCGLAHLALAQRSMVTLSATRDVILADGKQQTLIIADVRDQNGNPLNGATVLFQTTAGTLTQTRVTAVGGIAQTRLISAPFPTVAQVTAIAEGAGVGASNALQIEFTNDPEATVEGNNYVLFTGKYVAYSATDRIIEAFSVNGGSELSYRNFDIKADRIQFHCDDNAVVRAADNITLRRGKHVIHAIRLYYSLGTGMGYAIAKWNGSLQQVEITGVDLQMQKPHGIVPPAYFTMPQMQVKLVVVARSIAYFPGDKLQFTRPRFFQDNLQILSLPYYEMSLNSDQLFSDHFISVGSRGFGLELPFYYDLTPRSSGIIYLRHDQQLGRGYFSTDPGWSIDLMQSYSGTGEMRYEGSYGFTDLTRGGWGFQWTHTQEFSDSTQGAFALDFPHHTGLIGSLDLSTHGKLGRLGIDFNGGQTWVSPTETSLEGDLYLETNPSSYGFAKGWRYVFGTRYSSNYFRSSGSLASLSNASSEEITWRTFPAMPMLLDRRTTLNVSFTLGHMWTTNHLTGFTSQISLGLDRTLPNGGDINFGYDFLSTPNPAYNEDGKHRVSITYQVGRSKHFALGLSGTAFLDSPSASFLADAVYRLDSRWRLLASATLQHGNFLNYQDFELTIGRRIGARELQLTYSTYTKRIYIDLTSTNW
ncbi:organic solvent tolerance protein OstA [Chthonomonas calidirosea]|uniref:Organic solvent tolerance protein OstA n=2 Tax=Chthonomonas TaxID=1077265 RepID=S0EWW0_CHTCT|nr:Organic solvent tolerance protein OstA [Chthonomonas calidirosea T49]CEK17432.1 organic solvent tolerance protein OstA [Chthonomonas calidirosea]